MDGVERERSKQEARARSFPDQRSVTGLSSPQGIVNLRGDINRRSFRSILCGVGPASGRRRMLEKGDETWIRQACYWCTLSSARLLG